MYIGLCDVSDLVFSVVEDLLTMVVCMCSCLFLLFVVYGVGFSVEIFGVVCVVECVCF